MCMLLLLLLKTLQTERKFYMTFLRSVWANNILKLTVTYACIPNGVTLIFLE